jgi:transposase-like protein
MPSSNRGRFSAKRKREAVFRLLRGHGLDLVSRELGVTAATLSKWREVFLEGSLGSLKTKVADERSERIQELERKLGQVVMENELLYGKIDRRLASFGLQAVEEMIQVTSIATGKPHTVAQICRV